MVSFDVVVVAAISRGVTVRINMVFKRTETVAEIKGVKLDKGSAKCREENVHVFIYCFTMLIVIKKLKLLL